MLSLSPRILEAAYNSTLDFYTSTGRFYDTFVGQMKDPLFDFSLKTAKLTDSLIAGPLEGPLSYLAVPVAKMTVCSQNIQMCAIKVAEYTAYDLPKTAAETIASLLGVAVSVPFWSAKKIYAFSSTAGQSIHNMIPSAVTDLGASISSLFHSGMQTPIYGNRTVHEFVTDKMLQQSIHNTKIPNQILETVVHQFRDLPGVATRWIKQGNTISNKELIPFHIEELSGAALLQSFSLYRTGHHLGEAVKYLKLIKDLKSEDSSYFIAKNADGSPVIRFNTDLHTLPSLVKDAAVETIFAGVWGTLAIFSYQGIYSAVKLASGCPEKAFLVANAVLIGGTIAPKIFGWVIGKIVEQPEIIEQGEGLPSCVVPIDEPIGSYSLDHDVVESELSVTEELNLLIKDIADYEKRKRMEENRYKDDIITFD